MLPQPDETAPPVATPTKTTLTETTSTPTETTQEPISSSAHVATSTPTETTQEPISSSAHVAPPVPEAGAAAASATQAQTPTGDAAAAPAEPNKADCGPQLKQLFPALFVGAPKPLKLRIQLDIQQRAPGRFTKQALSAFFRRYTGSTSYLLAVANGKQRYDLDGQPAGEIADEHRQVARDELARRRANHEQRRALEDQQRYNRAGLLHDYERTTLTRANFCVLKQVAEEELDGLLALAREEAAQRRTAPPHAPEHRGSRHREPDRGRPERHTKSRT